MIKPSIMCAQFVLVLLGVLDRRSHEKAPISRFNAPLFFLLIASIATYAGSTVAADIRVNVGGKQYTDSVGNVWSADRGFNTGKVSTRKMSIAGTTDDPLYYNQRYDSGTSPEMVYSFAVPNGDYAVNLLFAETYSGAYGEGLRVFDVAIEGALVLDNVDIFSQAGGSKRSLIRNVPLVTVTDGQMNIKFIHHVENPKVAAIEIVALGGDTKDRTPPTAPQNVSAVAVGPAQVNLTWSPSTDVGGGQVAGYKVHRDGKFIGSVTGTSYSDNNVKPGASYKYTISAFDTAAPVNESIKSTSANITMPASSSNVTAPASSPFAIRVNVGGGRYTDGVGNVWSADRGFNTGKVSTRKMSIAGTTDDPLYYNQRYDSGTSPEMVYSFAVPNGDYAVNLHFAETYSGAYGVGLRVFDVGIEGARVLDNVDIFSEAGGSKRSLIRSVPLVTVTDGQINIQFIHQVENPKVAAIEIVGLGGNTTTASPATVTPPANTGNAILYVNHNNISAGHVVTRADIQNWFLADQGKAGIYNDGLLDIVRDPSGDPGRGNVMRCFQPQGSYGTCGRWRSWSGEFSELYFAFDIYLEPGRLWSKTMKLPGFVGGKWEKPDGISGFTTRPMITGKPGYPNKPDGTLTQYSYYVGKKRVVTWGKNSGGQYATLTPGKWHTIETHIKINTPNSANGKLGMWIDGVKVVNRSNIKWRAGSNLKLDGLYFNFGYGGSTSSFASPEDQYNYYDNWTLSTRPISH